MGPSAREKTEDDFILTISDNEDNEIADEEEVPSSPKLSSKKRKRDAQVAPKKSKKAKVSKRKDEDEVEDEDIVELGGTKPSETQMVVVTSTVSVT